ncbi:MAG: hypothetical protein E7033_01995 [Akkermansiaceae bacterium]|nr:hypothetical protein [Akkermansiaceae bacterium]
MPRYSLSDPYHDFDSKEERAWLDAITAKQGRGITESDLHWVFQGYLPAGTYAECCCYLRPLYDFLRAHPSYHDLWENLVEIWIPMHLKELQADGTLGAVMEEVNSIYEEKLKSYLRGEMCLEDMKLMTISYLFAAPLADRHEALIARLLQTLHGRMVLLSICAYGDICRPAYLDIPETHAPYFRRPQEVAAQIRTAQGYTDLRAYLAQLVDEVLAAAETGAVADELLDGWDRVLTAADAATMHLPGGPLCAAD